MKRIRVLLANDHKILLEGVKCLLGSALYEIVGTVEDGRALVAESLRLRPNVVVTDIALPLLNGIEAVRRIKKAERRIQFVFLTMHPDASFAERAFKAGASGYVLKQSEPRELITAIQEAVRGRTYITPLIAGELLTMYGKADSTADKWKRITHRQREICQLVAEGKSAKEIATLLNISSRTVEFHKYSVMRVLKMKTSADLIRFAVRSGLVSV